MISGTRFGTTVLIGTEGGTQTDNETKKNYKSDDIVVSISDDTNNNKTAEWTDKPIKMLLVV